MNTLKIKEREIIAKLPIVVIPSDIEWFSIIAIENLLLAMAEVLKKLPDSLLVIGGTGPLREKLSAAP